MLDVLARLFAKQTEAVIRRGIYRAYVEREENLRFVRGRILPLSDLRANQGLRHQVSCRYSEQTADVLHNQILLSATEQFRHFTTGCRAFASFSHGMPHTSPRCVTAR